MQKKQLENKLKEKDREMKRLKDQVAQMQAALDKDVEKGILRKKVKELEQDNR